MINSLRKKMIIVSAMSILAVVAPIFFVISVIGTRQLNHTMDMLTDIISENEGHFPDFDPGRPRPPRPQRDIITPETRFSTRFFTIWFDTGRQFTRGNIESISSITGEQATAYAQSALERGKERGWISDYRYKVVKMEDGYMAVLVDGSMNRSMTRQFLLTAFLVLSGSGFVVLLLIILFSRKAVLPAAESYEKQKQFITDANHELKTPLTLILSNLDILESEFGKSEWLDDIRSEAQRMGALINQLMILARMDEDTSNLSISSFDLTAVVLDTVSEFRPLAARGGKAFRLQVDRPVIYNGDESLIRRLVSVLLDNAVKYCDPEGTISVSVCAKKNPVLIIENSCKEVNTIKLDRVFDRFYRADKARNYTGSFGIGLSIAKAIARNHHGDVTAYKKDSHTIGFKTVLKQKETEIIKCSQMS